MMLALGTSLGKLCMYSVDYSHIDINEEPFGCLPTTSLVVQVLIIIIIIIMEYFRRKLVYC